MKSAFDDEEQYELTDLGQQFVYYAMTDLRARSRDTSDAEAAMQVMSIVAAG
jgi:hypothetical protein